MPTVEEIQQYLAPLAPYQDYIVMVVNGLIAGWLAGLLLGGGGLIRSVIVGVVGAFVGGALVKHGLLTLPAVITDWTAKVPYGPQYGQQIIISTIGAMIIILVARFLGGRA